MHCCVISHFLLTLSHIHVNTSLYLSTGQTCTHKLCMIRFVLSSPTLSLHSLSLYCFFFFDGQRNLMHILIINHIHHILNKLGKYNVDVDKICNHNGTSGCLHVCAPYKPNNIYGKTNSIKDAVNCPLRCKTLNLL